MHYSKNIKIIQNIQLQPMLIMLSAECRCCYRILYNTLYTRILCKLHQNTEIWLRGTFTRSSSSVSSN